MPGTTTAQSPSRHVLLKQFRHRIDPDTQKLGSYERLPSKRGRRVTQEEIADAVGVSRVWYAVLESKARARTSPNLLNRLADTLMMSHVERVALYRAAIPELSVLVEEARTTAGVSPWNAMQPLPAFGI